MNPFSIINPIAKMLLSSRRRTQVIPNKKKKDQSRKNKKWKKMLTRVLCMIKGRNNSFLYTKNS